MGFLENLLKGKHRDKYDHHHHSHHLARNLIGPVLDRAVHSKVLIAFLIIGLIVVVVAMITLVFLLLPLFYNLISYVNQNGLKGVFNFIFQFINRLWEGGGKA